GGPRAGATAGTAAVLGVGPRVAAASAALGRDEPHLRQPPARAGGPQRGTRPAAEADVEPGGGVRGAGGRPGSLGGAAGGEAVRTHWLFDERGKEWLLREYFANEKS